MLGGLTGNNVSVEIFEEGRVLNHEFDNITKEKLPCLENSMGGGAWWATVYSVAKN